MSVDNTVSNTEHALAWGAVLRTLTAVADVVQGQDRANWLPLISGRLHESKTPLDRLVYTGARYLMDCIAADAISPLSAYDTRVLAFVRERLDSKHACCTRALMNTVAFDLHVDATEFHIAAFDRVLNDIAPNRASCDLLITHYLTQLADEGQPEEEKEQLALCLSIVASVTVSPLSADNVLERIKQCVNQRRNPEPARDVVYPDDGVLSDAPPIYREGLRETLHFANTLPRQAAGLDATVLDNLRQMIQRLESRKRRGRP
jgi:hypothetical protein